MRLRTLLFVLILMGCAPSTEPFVEPESTSEAQTTDAGVPPSSPTADPCDLRAETTIRLHGVGTTIRPQTRHLARGTRLELLAVSNRGRGTPAHPAIECRVRVRETGEEGWAFLHAAAVGRCQQSQSSDPAVYETHHVRVGGVDEVWTLRIVGRYETPQEESLSCADRYDQEFEPLHLQLERHRDGRLAERIDHIADGDESVSFNPLRSPWPGLVRTTALDIGDYNHDGQASEFALDVRLVVSGMFDSAVFGVTPSQPRLHLITTANGVPMSMPLRRWGWEPVRRLRAGREHLWSCGFREGSSVGSYRWETTPRGFVQHLDVTQMDDACTGPIGAAEDFMASPPTETTTPPHAEEAQ